MRLANSCLLFAVANCASPAPIPAIPPRPAPASARPTLPVDLSARGVALFVRDTTERGLTLASLVLDALRRRGVDCRLVVAESSPTPPWSLDDAQARQSGAPYAARISVVTRAETKRQVHQQDLTTQRSTGVVIGPTYDAAPIDFPELKPPGGLERRDVGGHETEEGLRLEVMASLRRVGWEQPIARWSIAPGAREPLRQIHGAVADRLAELIVERLSRERD